MKTFISIVFIMVSIVEAMAQSEGKYANVNGLKMYYEIHGKGFPLVLIHGGGSTIGTTFGRILPRLAKTHQVIAVEMQAHGRTPDVDRPLTFEQDADDIAALLKHLNISKADIFGFSNGASTTLQIAIRHPEVVNKIVVASTMYKKAGSYPWFWDMMQKATFEEMPQPYKDAFLAINPDKEALYKMYLRDVTRMQNFKDMKEEDIKAIKAPALIILGNNDVVSPEHGVEMYRQMQKAKLMILPGGHGDYIGELATVQPGNNEYPAVSIIEEFLNEKAK
ncbi:MAG TPA: alpha/beta hydrolase [Chryseolinea sp.]|nr:alpha/beta hydrolase [Chryseolinea sp.]